MSPIRERLGYGVLGLDFRGSRVRLCVTDTGGHAWPGGGKLLGKPKPCALSATAEMERFFFGR